MHAHSAATAVAAAASHAKPEEMQEHSISCDAESKDKAYAIQSETSAKLTSKGNNATFDTLELYGGFSTVISDSVVTKLPMKMQWPMVLSTSVSQTTLLNFSEDGNGQSTDNVTLSSREKLDTMRAYPRQAEASLRRSSTGLDA